MKIYQIHEYGGEYEDSFDFIVMSLLHEERAIAEKERLEREATETIRCSFCPLHCDESFTKNELTDNYKQMITKRITKAKELCEHYELEDENAPLSCANYYTPLYDSFYRIEEVDVIE